MKTILLILTSMAFAVSRQLQSQLLADAIPAEPLPAGFTSVPSWGVDNPFGHSEAIAGHKDSV